MSIAAIGGAAQPPIVSGASASAPPQTKMSNLFQGIDAGNNGSITQAQFNQAFQSQNPPAVFQAQGASAIWNQLDPNGTGSVSKQDFVNTMKQLMVSLRAEPGATLGASQQSLGGISA